MSNRPIGFYLLGVFFFVPSWLSAGKNFNKELLVNKLRQQENLARSAISEYDVILLPTKPEDKILLIKLGGDKDHLMKQYYYSEEHAKANSYSAKWWRNGIMERLEIHQNNGIVKIFAFDGNVSRTIIREKGTISSVIEPFNKALWLGTHRPEPFSLLFFSGSKTYSEIIEQGIEEKISQINFHGETCDQIIVRRGPKENLLYSFIFNEKKQIKEKRIKISDPKSKKQTLTQITNYLDYQPIQTPSGEVIWFPKSIQINQIAGKLDVPVNYYSKKINIKDIKFNENIPKELFVLDFPQNSKILDRVTGQGWLPKGEAEGLWTHPPYSSKNSFLIWAGIIAGTILVTLLGFFWWRKRRKPLVQS